MIDRYDDPTDAIPHETTVLVLNETDRLFGDQPADTFDDVRSKLTCDKLLLEEHYHSLDDLPEYDKLVQYAVWVVHQSCLFTDRATQLGSYLRTGSFPDETQVLVVLDADDDGTREYMQDELDGYSDELTVVTSETALTYYLLGHLQTANPCNAAGLDYLVSWNNKVSDTIGPHQDID